jgi:hypothetical protein
MFILAAPGMSPSTPFNGRKEIHWRKHITFDGKKEIHRRKHITLDGKKEIHRRKHILALQRYAKRCSDVSSSVMMEHERELDKAHIGVQFYTAKLWTTRKPRQLSQSRECDIANKKQSESRRILNLFAFIQTPILLVTSIHCMYLVMTIQHSITTGHSW